MDSRHHPLDGVIQQHGHAVRRPYADGDARQVGHEGVIPLQFLLRHPRPVHDRHPAPMHLMSLYDRIGEDRLPLGVERLHSGLAREKVDYLVVTLHRFGVYLCAN